MEKREMTVSQIADAAGCSDNTVRKLANNMFPLKKASKRGVAKRYNEDECFSIMDKLPKRNNVEVNSEVNTDLAPLDNSSTAVMQMFKMMMDQNNKQQEQNQMFMTAVLGEIKNISKPASLQIEQPKQDYYSLLAYCNVKKIKVTHSESIMHGKHLKKVCSEKNVELRTIPDERWGKVNSYPAEVLEEYFTI
jgi:hypothetical protein